MSIYINMYFHNFESSDHLVYVFFRYCRNRCQSLDFYKKLAQKC